MQVLKDHIRYQILAEAQHLFLEQGYEKTSMNQIAESIPVSKSNLYHYYASKQAIFDALIEKAAARLRQVLLEYRQSGGDPGNDGREAQVLLTSRVSTLLEEEKYGLLLLMQAGGTRYEALTKSLTDIFASKIALRIRDADSRELIAQIAAQNIVQGTISILRSCVHPEDIRAAIGKLVAYHSEGMQALTR